nr:TrmH family RNA methyltransferase [Phytoactinopolyspora alkaliphila]
MDGVQSPFNVGAMVRSAAVFGVSQFYLAGRTASPRDAKAQKLAMGTDRYLDTQVFAEAAEAVGQAKADGYRVVGLELTDTARPLHEMALAEQDVCVAIGAEDHGLSAAVLSVCDEVAYIPQVGKVGSLNVATAAALACYELRRQDWTAPT